MEKHQNDLRRGWPRQIARGEPQPEQRNSFEHIAPCSTQAPSLGLYSTLSSPTLTVMCTRPNSMSVDMAEAELTRNACDLGQAAKRPSAKSECSGAQPSLWETPHFGRSKSGIDRDLYLSISIYTYLYLSIMNVFRDSWNILGPYKPCWFHLARRRAFEAIPFGPQGHQGWANPRSVAPQGTGALRQGIQRYFCGV